MEYKRQRGAVAPFITKTNGKAQSGSSWGRAELEWIGVSVERNLEISNVIERKWCPNPGGKVAIFLRQELSKPWTEVQDPSSNLGRGTFYSHLRYLATFQEKLDAYEQSVISFNEASRLDLEGSVPQSDASVSESLDSSPPAVQRSSPANIVAAKRPKSAPLPPFVKRKSQLLFRSITPECSEIASSSSHSSRLSPSLRYTRDLNPRNHKTRSSGSTESIEIFLNDIYFFGEEILADVNQDEEQVAKQDADTATAGWHSDSVDDQGSDVAIDTSRKTSLSEVQLAHQSTALEDKAEVEVEWTAKLFFNILENALGCGDPALETNTTRGQTLDIELKDGSMTTTPDLTLWVMANSQTGDGRKLNTEIGLFTECKRKLHHKTQEEIFGQEYSHLIGTASLRNKHPRPRDTHKVYLISWHHLECYISRFEVTSKHLQHLARMTPPAQKEPPQVKQTKVFNMADPEDRFQVAMAIMAIVIENHAEFYRYERSGLLDRLRS